jgi:hypothetical protein
VLALIGDQWVRRLLSDPAEDHVVREIDLALTSGIPALPVLIGEAAMPRREEMPPRLAKFADHNALRIDVGREFENDLNRLIAHLDAIRTSKAYSTIPMSDQLIAAVCETVVQRLRQESSNFAFADGPLEFMSYEPADFSKPMYNGVSLLLHRVVLDSTSLVELHVLLTAWGRMTPLQHRVAGWLVAQFRSRPTIPIPEGANDVFPPGASIAVFPSGENAREIWSALTKQPYSLSIPYILRVRGY